MKKKLAKFFQKTVVYFDQHPTKSTIALFVLVALLIAIISLRSC